MILPGHSTPDLDLVQPKGLTDKLAYPDCQIPYQHAIAVFGEPYEVVTDFVLYVLGRNE